MYIQYMYIRYMYIRYMYIRYMCAVTFLWFNRQVRVVLGAVDDNMQAPHTLHCAQCDLRTAFGLQTNSGHGTGLHVQSVHVYAACFFVFVVVCLFFSALPRCFWLADAEQEKKRCGFTLIFPNCCVLLNPQRLTSTACILFLVLVR